MVFDMPESRNENVKDGQIEVPWSNGVKDGPNVDEIYRSH